MLEGVNPEKFKGFFFLVLAALFFHIHSHWTVIQDFERRNLRKKVKTAWYCFINKTLQQTSLESAVLVCGYEIFNHPDLTTIANKDLYAGAFSWWSSTSFVTFSGCLDYLIFCAIAPVKVPLSKSFATVQCKCILTEAMQYQILNLMHLSQPTNFSVKTQYLHFRPGILDHTQSILFCLGKFLKWLADDYSSSITISNIYTYNLFVWKWFDEKFDIIWMYLLCFVFIL